MIHRTRQGRPPSGGPVPGRQLIEIDGVFVEYSGEAPDRAALDAHRNPPPPAKPKAPSEPAGNSVAALRAELAAMRLALIDAGIWEA